MEKNNSQKQISAEQILLEAYDRKEEPLKKTNLSVADLEELHESQRRTRQEYEDALRRNRLDFPQWMRYAQFEVDQNDIRRSRSIFERALEINPHHVPLWIRYIDTELKQRNINHARNLLLRATELLPRIDKLWFKYVQTEEYLQNIIGVRAIFKKWIQWEPDYPVWDAFVSFEKRYDEFDNVRSVFNQYVNVHPKIETWLKWANFEMNYGDSSTVRQVFSAGIDSLPQSETLIVRFANYEAKVKEFERARSIFKFGKLRFPDSTVINQGLIDFEKQFGDKDGIEISLIQTRKVKYEEDLKKDPSDYDTWWAYLTVIEDYPIEFRRSKLQESYSTPPTSNDKFDWKRFIFLIIRHAIFEELQNEPEKVRSIYDQTLKLLKKHKLNFNKIWISYSNFEIRQNEITKARKLLGRAIGTKPTHKIFRHYIELEIKLKEFDRVRAIYNKALEIFPDNIEIWENFATFENDLGDFDRAREIYKLALEFTGNDEGMLGSFIEYEIEQRNYDKVRGIFEGLITSNKKDTKVWINYANVEVTIPTKEQLEEYQKKVEETGDDGIEFEFEILDESKARARVIFEKALKTFKMEKLTNERIIIYKAFENFESQYGDENTLKKIRKRLPTVVKKVNDNKEVMDYIFPDDEKFNKFLMNAKKWADKNK